jgi:hypothetical protein
MTLPRLVTFPYASRGGHPCDYPPATTTDLLIIAAMLVIIIGLAAWGLYRLGRQEQQRAIAEAEKTAWLAKHSNIPDCPICSRQVDLPGACHALHPLAHGR